MSLTRVYRPFKKLKKIRLFRQYSQPSVLNQDEYTETPQYPPILDMSLAGRKRRERELMHEKIKKLNTVEEKQIALNMPRYYGWQCTMLQEKEIPFNSLPFIQHYTRSHFISIEELPHYYNDFDTKAAEVVKEIKPLVEDAISMEHDHITRNFQPAKDKPEKEQRENAAAKNIVRQVNRIISNSLSEKVPHMIYAQVDYDPRHEAFWFVGGVDPPSTVVNWRNKLSYFKKFLNDPIDRPVQYIGNPFVAIRNRHPLQPLLPHSEAENPQFKVEKFTYKPECAGYFSEFRHGTNIPGFWPGEYDAFGCLSVHGRGHLHNRRPEFGPEDNIEALHCQALQASFGWLLAQANYQGFTTYNDITYPLVTQTVITNGHLWSIYCYQLNTIVMHNEQMDENPKYNVCYGTQPLKLYETIENGLVKGFNDDVLKTLVKLYMNTPQERDHEMKPYLGKDEQLIADIEDEKRRCWLEELYKHLMANRPRHKLLPEVYDWERIYKIRFKTRPADKQDRWFEQGINPFDRRLDEHLPPYIPKVLRPYPKSRKKFETTYYPDVLPPKKKHSYFIE